MKRIAALVCTTLLATGCTVESRAQSEQVSTVVRGPRPDYVTVGCRNKIDKDIYRECKRSLNSVWVDYDGHTCGWVWQFDDNDQLPGKDNRLMLPHWKEVCNQYWRDYFNRTKRVCNGEGFQAGPIDAGNPYRRDAG